MRVGSAVFAPDTLRLSVGFYQIDLFLITAGKREVVERFLVDWEQSAGGAIFGGHIANGRPVGKGEVAEPRTEKFDELAHHPGFAQHLRYGEHQVGRRGSFAQAADEAKAYNLRD